jgi:hypothetical protein
MMMKKEIKMTKNLSPKAIDYKRLVAIQAMAAKELELATEAIREYEKELRAEVVCVVGHGTTTLQYDGRVIKLVRHSLSSSRFAFNIKENGKLIKRDCPESLNDIRFLFALGKI